MVKNLKLGCDPEIFLMDKSGKLRASCGLIGGTKHDPMGLPALGDGFAVQEDNVAIEFNIPPASSVLEFQTSVRRTLQHLTELVKVQDFTLVNLSAASFPDDELIHPQALTFGCDPDFNAWTLRRNPRPEAEDKNLRSCGGHVHIGFNKGDHDPVRVIRAMDLFLGVPSVLMDKGELRRKLYGKAGAFRDKPYGAEYRTLSNFWVFDEQLTKWVWNNTNRAIEAVDAQFGINDYKDSILDAINNNNKDAARFLVQECKLEVLNV